MSFDLIFTRKSSSLLKPSISILYFINSSKNLVISLIDDGKTRDKMRQGFEDNYLQINNGRELDNLEQILATHKSDRIVLIGHIEDGKFVSKSDDVKEKLFEIPIKEVNRLQKKYDLLLFPIGCESINNGSEIGFSENINSVKAVDAISSAFGANTYSDYYDALSMEGLAFYVNNKQIENQVIFEGVLETQREIANENEHTGRVISAIVYSRNVNQNDTVNQDSESVVNYEVDDEATPLNVLWGVTKTILELCFGFWVILKIWDWISPTPKSRK